MERLFRFLYTDPIGRRARSLVLESKLLHTLAEKYTDHALSCRHIDAFVAEQGIDLSDAVVPDGGFSSFNDFFTRAYRPEVRPLDRAPEAFVAPADAYLLLVPEISRDQTIRVKGVEFSVSSFIGDDALARQFVGGTAAIFRLYLSGCHRLIFPADGTPGPMRDIPGGYYSISPLPYNDVPFYVRNHRVVSAFDSAAFGPLVMVDVGGFLISSVRPSFEPGARAQKGEPRSRFAYGGSTLVVFSAAGRVRYREDILASSRAGDEHLVKVGERVGVVGGG